MHNSMNGEEAVLSQQKYIQLSCGQFKRLLENSFDQKVKVFVLIAFLNANLGKFSEPFPETSTAWSSLFIFTGVSSVGHFKLACGEPSISPDDLQVPPQKRKLELELKNTSSNFGCLPG